MSHETPTPADIRVVKGEPTDEELAAVVAAIKVVWVRAATKPTPRPSNWSAYWRSVRTPLRPGSVGSNRAEQDRGPGPDGWRASTRPHR